MIYEALQFFGDQSVNTKVVFQGNYVAPQTLFPD